MSLKVKPLPPIPVDTAQVVEQILPPTNLFRWLGEQLSDLVSDEDFADLYAVEGKPGLSPALLVMVTVFQFLETLSDRQAAAMVVSRLDWKYALHLPLAYAGFDHSVLCEFRVRLLKQDAQARVFEKVLQALTRFGLLKGRALQRTDSLAVLSAVRNLSRLELTMETLRLALNALETADAAWLRSSVPTSWAERYAQWTQHERLVHSKGEAARVETQRLLQQTGEDGQWLLNKLASSPPALAQLPAGATLRQVWAQQFEVLDQQVQARAKVDTCGAELLQTPHDPQARYGEHGGRTWNGYQLHLTETADPVQPRIITDVHTTPAGYPDCKQLDPIQQHLAGRGLLPAQQLADLGYVNGPTLAQSAKRGVALLGPVQADTSRQARWPGGLTADQFTFNYEQQQAICPGGQFSRTWSFSQNESGASVIHIRFAAAVCQVCPLQPRCLPAAQPVQQGRTLKIKPTHELVKRRRQEQATAAFKEIYRQRAGVEASLSVWVRAYAGRVARYRGLRKVHLQHLFIAAATNLNRAVRWLSGLRPLSQRKPGLQTLRQLT